MSSEVIPMRSRNNNVFHYSAYWRTWSRILFHDADGRGMQQMRRKYEIPDHIKTVEIDLTAINPTTVHHWLDTIQYGNLRAHCTPIGKDDIIVGSLDSTTLHLMQQWLPARTVDILLHADILPFIDWEVWQKRHVGGGILVQHALKECVSLEQYAAIMGEGAGPGVFAEDFAEAWRAFCEDWN